MRFLLLVAVLCGACSASNEYPAVRSATVRDTSRAREQRQRPADSESKTADRHIETFVISGPTLITTFVATQAEIDSSADANEALGDYQLYLGQAMPILQQHGVRVEGTSDSVVQWRDSLGVHAIVAADSGGIMYLFVTPNGKRTLLREGVITSGEILDAAAHQFNLTFSREARGRAP